MQIYLVFALLISLWLWPAQAHADGYVETTGTYAEGAQIRGDRYDTGGNKKVTQGTLSSGEDQTNNLLMTSGGVVRGTTLTSAVTTARGRCATGGRPRTGRSSTPAPRRWRRSTTPSSPIRGRT